MIRPTPRYVIVQRVIPFGTHQAFRKHGESLASKITGIKVVTTDYGVSGRVLGLVRGSSKITTETVFELDFDYLATIKSNDGLFEFGDKVVPIIGSGDQFEISYSFDSVLADRRPVIKCWLRVEDWFE